MRFECSTYHEASCRRNIQIANSLLTSSLSIPIHNLGIFQIVRMPNGFLQCKEIGICGNWACVADHVDFLQKQCVSLRTQKLSAACTCGRKSSKSCPGWRVATCVSRVHAFEKQCKLYNNMFTLNCQGTSSAAFFEAMAGFGCTTSVSLSSISHTSLWRALWDS